MNKKLLTERDICTKFITPALMQAGWDLNNQVREEVSFTNGRIIVRGKLFKRGKSKRADFILYYKHSIPIAIIEAKDNNHSIGSGMQQALEYSEMLNIPFVFSSNGDAFLFHDSTVKEKGEKVERELSLEHFPSPSDLWSKYCKWKGIESETQKAIIEEDYFADISGKAPRYYQLNAINKTIESIAIGQNRILLVMATGTGKTYTAFQIIWRLWKSKTKKRILYLADRNILVDQTITNDFKPFKGVMTKISKRQINKAYEIYLSLYQAVTGNEEERNIYKQFTRDFFDLIIVDECHRGSAAEDAAWHEILTYFSSATQIGMTATPKETEDVSNINYFGEPIYTYSLKQGIDDGFLAPYKVIRIDIDKDLQGWRPPKDKVDKYGQIIEDRVYNQKDFDKTLVLEKRTELVAKKVTEFLQATDSYSKTIIFCDNIDHADRMRQAIVNENLEMISENKKYVMKITGDDDEGKAELDNFIDPEQRYPVIATTSKLLSTGVDAQTCKLIVLDQRINSMTEFKQIIGRGTRINEEYDKFFFTIMDFKKATELFADPSFDGDPVQIYEPKGDEPVVPPDVYQGIQDDKDIDTTDVDNPFNDDETTNINIDLVSGSARRKYYVNDVPVMVVAERVQYYDRDGKLITESLKDYTKKTINSEFKSLDDFLVKWSSAEKKEAIIKELEENGIFLEALSEEVGRDYDSFDLICHVAWGMPPLTRKERAENVKKRNYFTKYGEKAQKVINALLEKYSTEGIINIETLEILSLSPFDQIGTPLEIVKTVGGKLQYENLVNELVKELYAA
jgi:type I restriction enzyme R subunit